MKKYVCDVCGWIYEEALGDPENGFAPARSLKIFPMILFAPCAASVKTNFP